MPCSKHEIPSCRSKLPEQAGEADLGDFVQKPAEPIKRQNVSSRTHQRQKVSQARTWLLGRVCCRQQGCNTEGPHAALATNTHRVHRYFRCMRPVAIAAASGQAQPNSKITNTVFLREVCPSTNYNWLQLLHGSAVLLMLTEEHASVVSSTLR